MDRLTDPLRHAYLGQARACEGLGSAFSAGLLRLAAGELERPFAPLAAPWCESSAERIVSDAVPIRLLGALHGLVLGGTEPELGRLYPALSPVTDWTAVRSVLADVALRRRAELAGFMTSPPQTNEVRRAFALVGGFLQVAAETGLPLRCLEIGASAGLLQNWDRFRYHFGEREDWGPAHSPLLIDGDWRGPPPALGAKVKLLERLGCDIAPVDILDPGARLRLQAYVWADQPDRMERLRGALAVAEAAGVKVDAADAGDWTALHLHPRPGAATVLHHSVMWQYMPAASRNAVRAAIGAAAAAATADAPIAWLKMEPPDLGPVMDIRLTLWPGGVERLLGRCHPHGAWVEWLDA